VTGMYQKNLNEIFGKRHATCYDIINVSPIFKKKTDISLTKLQNLDALSLSV